MNDQLKVMTKIKDGEPIRSDAIYKRSEWIVTGYEDSGHQLLDDTPVRTLFHWYEVPLYDDVKATKDTKIIIKGKEIKDFKLTHVRICEEDHHIEYFIEGMVQKFFQRIRKAHK